MTAVPAGWKEAPLGDVCQVASGATPKTEVAGYWGGDIRWLTPNDLSKDRSQTLYVGERTLTQAGYDSCSARLFPAGSVIVSSRAPVGYVAIAGEEMCTNQGCKTAVPPDYLDSKYLYWYLLAAKPDLEARASGTTFKEISGRRFAETLLRFPDLEEQHLIVELLEDHLSRLDAAEQGLRISLARIRRLRESALVEAIGTAQAHACTAMKTIGDLATVTTGVTPLKSNRAFYDGGTIPWITSGDLASGVVDAANQFVTERAISETSLKLVKAGAILLAMYGEGKTRGTAALLDIDATTNQACAAIQLHDTNLRPWVKMVLDSNYAAMRRMAAGGVQPNLNLSLVRSIEVPVPAAEIREAALQRLREIEEQGSILRRALEVTLRRGVTLRHALLAAAFSGGLSARARSAA
jgi:type I restriction enzyme, S subunit